MSHAQRWPLVRDLAPRPNRQLRQDLEARGSTVQALSASVRIARPTPFVATPTSSDGSMVFAQDQVTLSSTQSTVAQRLRSALGWVHLINTDSIVELAHDQLRRREERRLLGAARAGRAACSSEEAEPLVTVRVSSYQRADVLLERTIPSILAQTYSRLEVLVVGDCTTDDTEERLRGVGDPRIRYINLPYRPQYPVEDAHRWRVLGYQALNVSLDLARGSWIAPCDDDDELTPDHVEVMLATAQRSKAEFVHSNTGLVLGSDVLGVIGRPEVGDGHTSHGAIFYSSALRFFRYNGHVWRLRRSLDWDLVLRMADAGVHMAYLDKVTYLYYPSPASLTQWRTKLLALRPDLAPQFREHCRP